MTEWDRGTAEEVLDEVLAVYSNITYSTIAAVLIEWQNDDGVSAAKLLETQKNAMALAFERGVLEYVNEDTVLCDGCGRLCGVASRQWAEEVYCQYCVDGQAVWEQGWEQGEEQ